MIDHRQNALEQTLEALDKRWGAGSVMRLGDRPVQSVSVVSSGSRAVDEVLGIGGYPRGRLVEVFGPESSGKTTLALHAIASVQKSGGIAAFIDAEHALDVTYAKALGVNTDALLVSQPDNGEQALEIAEALVRSGAIDLLVVDSVAALVPRAELEGEMGDAHVGLQARLMSQALRKLTAITSRTNTILIFLNQLRQKIGVTFGNGETTTGGNALKFYASIRIDIRRIGALKSGKEDAVGNRTRIKVIKNKLAPPFQSVEVDMIYGRGICAASELLNLAEERGVFTKSGSWYALGEERLGNGKEAVRDRLITEPALFARVAALLEPPGPAALAK